VTTDPQHIDAFIAEVEHKVSLIEHNPNTKAAMVMLVGNMYKHFKFDEIVQHQATLGHII
jgi:hypothetical protein